MFPIGDDDSARRSLPVVTYALIALNVLFFLVELNGGESFVRQWAFIPSRFGENPAGDVPTIFSAMFMHGGWLHLGGNALSVDLWRQRRGRVRAGQILDLLSRLRYRGDICTVLRHAPVQHSERRRFWSDRGRSRRLPAAVPARARTCANGQSDRGSARPDGAWTLDRASGFQRCGVGCADVANAGALFGSHVEAQR